MRQLCILNVLQCFLNFPRRTFAESLRNHVKDNSRSQTCNFHELSQFGSGPGLSGEVIPSRQNQHLSLLQRIMIFYANVCFLMYAFYCGFVHYHADAVQLSQDANIIQYATSIYLGRCLYPEEVSFKYEAPSWIIRHHKVMFDIH